jgi:carbon storage regulator CsrA
MLVLTRKQQESVVVGGPDGATGIRKIAVLVTVLAIKGGSVKLGFEARPDFPVHRWEVWQRICAGAGSKAGSAGLVAN